MTSLLSLTDKRVITDGNDLWLPVPTAERFLAFYKRFELLTGKLATDIPAGTALATMPKVTLDLLTDLRELYTPAAVELSIPGLIELLFYHPDTERGEGLLFSQNFTLPHWTLTPSDGGGNTKPANRVQA